MSRVAITGATGFIGGALTAALQERGDEVIALTRDPERARLPAAIRAEFFDPTADGTSGVFEGTDAIVSLAGETINGRWTSEKKRRIFESRVLGTRRVVRSLAACTRKPKVLVSASAAGFYGTRGDEELDESSSPGDDFLASVCVAWEREAVAAQGLGVRVVCVRQGIVLGRGGALAPIVRLFRLGLGGPLGSGRQWFPWIHLDDVIGLYLRALDEPQLSGPFNAAGPEAATNRRFTRALGAALHRPTFVPAPAFALRIVLGEFADSVLASQLVVPRKARELSYEFKHKNVEQALLDIFARS